jgi:hypothetical protein
MNKREILEYIISIGMGFISIIFIIISAIGVFYSILIFTNLISWEISHYVDPDISGVVTFIDHAKFTFYFCLLPTLSLFPLFLFIMAISGRIICQFNLSNCKIFLGLFLYLTSFFWISTVLIMKLVIHSNNVDITLFWNYLINFHILICIIPNFIYLFLSIICILLLPSFEEEPNDSSYASTDVTGNTVELSNIEEQFEEDSV